MAKWFEIGLDNDKLKKDVAEANNLLLSIGNNSGAISKQVGYIAKGLAGFFSVREASRFANEVVHVRGELQQLEVAFTTMLKSKGEADKLMAQVVDFAAKTPFGLGEVASGTKQLLAYRIETENVIPTLKALGDVAAGLSIPIERLILNYGQVKTQAKLTGRELRDFNVMGVPLIAELSKNLNKSETEIGAMVSAGKIGFKDVEQAFKSMSSEGGQFANLMDKQSSTITGRISNLQDNIEQMFNKIGKQSEGTINKAIDVAGYLVENYEKIGKEIGGLVIAYGAYRAALIATAAAQSAKLKNTTVLELAKRRLTIAQWQLNKAIMANPYVFATAALVALGYATYKVITYQTEAEKQQSRLNKSAKEFETNVNSELSALNRLKGELSTTTKGSEEYQKVKDKIVSRFGEYYKNLGDEIDRVGSLDTVYQNLTASIRASFGARMYDEFMGKEQSASDDLVAKNLTKIQERLYKRLGDEKGASVFVRLRQSLLAGEEISEEIQSTLDKVQRKGTLRADARIDAWINNIQDSYTRLEEIDKKAKKRFGVDDKKVSSTNKTQDAEPSSNYGADYKTAKEKWETAKLELRKIEKDKDEFTTEQYNNAVEREKEAEKKYKELGGDTSKKTSVSKEKDDYSKLTELEQRLSVERARAARDNYFSVEQSKVDAMKDGASKTEAQMKLNHEKELEELDRQREDYLQRKIDNDKAIFEANPANKNKVFDGSNITLSETEDASFNQIRRNREQQQLNEQTDFLNEQIRRDQEAWSTIIQEYGTYQEKRLAITEEYNSKINDAQTGGEKELLRLERDKKLSDLDFEDFQNSIDFAEIFSNIDEKSTSAVEVLRDKIASYIEQAADKLTPEQLKVLSDALLNLDKTVQNRKPAQGLTQSIEKAKDAYEKLAQAKKDGLSEKEVKAFETSFKDAMMNVASKIGIVVGHIRDFGNIAQDLVGIFSDDGAEMVGDLTNIATGAGQAGEGLAKMAGGDIIGGIKDLAKGITQVVGTIVKMGDAAKEKRIQKLQEQIDALSESYEVLGREIEKAYSKSAANLIEQQNALLKQQQLLIKQQIAEENAKKKTDNDRIKDLQEQYDAITEQIADNAEAAKDAIFGEDIQSAISAFADAYLSIFDSGVDKAQSSKDIVVRMIRAMIVEAMKDSIGSSFMENFRNQMLAFMENDGLIDPTEQAMLEDMAMEMQTMLDEQFGWAESFLKNKQSQGAASYGAIKEITQDQASELIGRLAGIQMDGVERTELVEDIKLRRSDISDSIQLIYTIAQDSYFELVAIKNNTALIQVTNEKLDKVIKNTDNL